MRRREFATLLGGAVAAWPLAARAQASPKGPTIAWIGTSLQLNASFIENFLRGMRELGYAEGRNFEMLYRFTDGYQERLPALTEEVIRLSPPSSWPPPLSTRLRPRKPRRQFRSSRRRSRMPFIWA